LALRPDRRKLSVEFVFGGDETASFNLQLSFDEPKDQGPVVPGLDQPLYEQIVMQKLQKLQLSLGTVEMRDFFTHPGKRLVLGSLLQEKTFYCLMRYQRPPLRPLFRFRLC
jgi:hypothetical protein